MAKQQIMRTIREDNTALDRARKRIKIGQFISYNGEHHYEKVKGGLKEIPIDNRYIHLVIYAS